MKSISEAGDLKGKRVILRAGFNVPIVNGVIAETFRIDRTLKTLSYLTGKGARVIIVSHIENSTTDSLALVYEYLKKNGYSGMRFIEDIFNPDTYTELSELADGDVVLLENIRRHAGEKANDPLFVDALAALGELYVNDSFETAHRAHASIVGLPSKLPSYAGFLLEEEVAELDKLSDPKHPFLFIMGGAKFETKIPLAKKFVTTADSLFVAGALMNEFFESEGLSVGASLIDAKDYDLDSTLENKHLLLPRDVVVKNKAGDERTTTPDDLKKDEHTVDIGPKSHKALLEKAAKAKTIVWNGPLGLYEAGYQETSEELARVIAKSEAHSVIGGGDTLAVTEKLGLTKDFSFVSTGGGAMLEYLLKGTLPGLEALT